MWGPTPQRPLKLRTSKTFDPLELRFGKFPHELPFEVRPSEVVTNRLHRSSPTVLQPPTPRQISYWQHAHTATWAIILGKQTPWQQNNYQRLHVTHTARMLPQKIETQLMWGKTMISLETCLSACPAYSECRPLLILGSLNHTIFTVHNKRTSFLTIFHHGTGRLRWIQSRMINIRIICKNSESNQLLLRCVGKCKPSQASSEHWWNTSRERHGSEPWAHCVHDGYGRWTTAVMEGYM